MPVLHDEGGDAEKNGFGSCVFPSCWMYNLTMGDGHCGNMAWLVYPCRNCAA